MALIYVFSDTDGGDFLKTTFGIIVGKLLQRTSETIPPASCRPNSVRRLDYGERDGFEASAAMRSDGRSLLCHVMR